MFARLLVGAAVREIERVLAAGGVFATETKLSQALAHPVRTRGRRIRIAAASRLESHRHAGLWMSYRKAR